MNPCKKPSKLYIFETIIFNCIKPVYNKDAHDYNTRGENRLRYRSHRLIFYKKASLTDWCRID